MPGDESPWAPPAAHGREAAPADVSKAGELLGYAPGTPIAEGVPKYVDWYLETIGATAPAAPAKPAAAPKATQGLEQLRRTLAG